MGQQGIFSTPNTIGELTNVTETFGPSTSPLTTTAVRFTASEKSTILFIHFGQNDVDIVNHGRFKTTATIVESRNDFRTFITNIMILDMKPGDTITYQKQYTTFACFVKIG